MIIAHRFVSVFVCDRVLGVQVIGHVAACVCGWSGFEVKSSPTCARKQWRGHEAARLRWDPIIAEKRERETRQRVAAAVLERVTNPCERCQHMHMRDPVWTCDTDCQTCNPELPDRRYGPESIERLRYDAQPSTAVADGLVRNDK